MLSGIFKFIKSHNSKNWFCLIFIGLFTAILTAPMVLIGIPDGNDLPQHLRFASAFYESILNGDFFPGWASASNLGFGSIGIRYYPPAAYYLMAFTQMLTESWSDTFWINSFFWMFLGCAGVYFWAKQWLSPWQAAFTAILYGIIPYHSAQIYQYLLYAEFAAAGILPFCFLFATRIIRNGKFTDVVLFSISFSVLLLTHIPLTIIGSTGLAVYTLLLIDWKQSKKTIVNFLIAFGLSLSATAFHWLRAVTEINWVKHNSPQYYANGYYDFKKYFFPLIYSAGDAYERKILWHIDVTIIFSIILFLPLIVYLILEVRSKNENIFSSRKILYSLSVTGLFSIFIMSLPSSFIWNSLPVLQKTQFPWRWLSLASLIGVMSFAFGINLLISRYQSLKKLIGYAILLLVFSVLLFDLSQNIISAAFIPRDKFETKFAGIDRETECRCWWTIWAEAEALEKKEKVYAESRAVNITRWESERREFTVEKGNAGNVRLATFYHPHWKAEVNGSQIDVQRADDGSILIPVSGEESSIKLYFQEPYKLKIALFISSVTWIFLFGALFTAVRRQKRFQTKLMTAN
jgi:uncharacterized membrane protein